MWMENKKHLWKLDSEKNVDEWAFSEGYHNGPMCVKCGKSFCLHCSGSSKTMHEDCDVIDYICSECGEVSEKKSKYCSECGINHIEREWI